MGAFERLAHFPAVDVDADAIFIRSDNVWTSAGVTAGMNLALALVEQDDGRELALEVATEMVVYLKRPGGQSQFKKLGIAPKVYRERFATTGEVAIQRHASTHRFFGIRKQLN